ncbi:DALR anticodon-binding domain-containing protein [Allonocardiopsis opalescens]|uniref:arginine--tRNA ligase n=1 Tax=Allonocardiopsis opalescens TaxID=1144618 RepID=A0A2T0QCZ6_9ACTN|nr:DALR anticodon-binding domain-containing protein [Allonocardiopsis opalescens]PRY01772.1 arginyl-tRNA synthetase [Allonocardiopsis opalescens]
MTPDAVNAALSGAVSALVGAGVLSGAARMVPVPLWTVGSRASVSGRLDPPGPADSFDFATPFPIRLRGASAGRPPGEVAAALAERLAAAPGFAAARGHPRGMLLLRLADGALSELADEILAAGERYGSGRTQRPTVIEAVPAGELAAAGSLAQARGRVRAEVIARLLAASGARVSWQAPPPPAGCGPDLAGPLAALGADALRFAFCHGAAVPAGGAPAAPDLVLWSAQRRGNPVFDVRYAHAHAASALRHAADLRLTWGPHSAGDALGWQVEEGRERPDGVSAASAHPLGHPCERALLRMLFAFPGEVALAARGAKPQALVRYLEELADIYHDFHETCRVLPRGDDAADGTVRARLRLTAATRTVLGTGLRLIGVSAPERM